MTKFPCPCCEYLVYPSPAMGDFDICPVCFWEDDSVQRRSPDYSGGANRPSLLEAKANFRKYGASEERFQKYVRDPLLEEIPLESFAINMINEWIITQGQYLQIGIETKDHLTLYSQAKLTLSEHNEEILLSIGYVTEVVGKLFQTIQKLLEGELQIPTNWTSSLVSDAYQTWFLKTVNEGWDSEDHEQLKEFRKYKISSLMGIQAYLYQAENDFYLEIDSLPAEWLEESEEKGKNPDLSKVKRIKIEKYYLQQLKMQCEQILSEAKHNSESIKR